MSENLSLFDFLPSELELNPNLKATKKRSPRKKAIKIQEPSLFDFFYDEESTQEINKEESVTQEALQENLELSFEYEEVLKDIQPFSEEEKQEIIANTKNFELTMGYGIAKDSNKTILPKIDFTKKQNIDLGGAKTRAENNLQALELALTITEQNRYATKEEQEILAKFSGFGGLNSAFSDEDFNARLKAFLDKSSAHKLESAEIYARLLSSSYNAYYTNDLIIDTIYQGLEQLGLKETSQKKEILEPSCGAGNFLHKGDKSSYHFTGIELEKHSAMIAKLLHPNSKIINSSFQHIQEEQKFDAIIGNPPFGQDKIKDNNSLAHNQAIDDYFVIKSLEQLKDKGILAFVMPTGFLDNNQNKHLDLIKEAKGKFLGAVRLPHTAFKQSGTEVNTDIIFLQKEPEFIEKLENNKIKKVKNEIDSMPMPVYNSLLRDEINNLYESEKEKDEEFKLEINEFYSKFKINSYFIDNPQNILGKQIIEKNQFGELKAVVKDDGRDLELALQNFINTLPKNIYEYKPNETEQRLRFDFVEFEGEYINKLQNGHYFYNFENQSICKKLNQFEYKELNIGENKQEVAKQYILLRDSLNTLSKLEIDSQVSDEEIQKARTYLNESYDFIKSKHQNKPLQKIFAELDDELQFNLVINLEDENNQKRDIFTKRITFPQTQMQVSNAKEAYIASFSKFGKLNLEYLSQALPQDLQTTLDELEEQKLIFKDHNNTFNYIPRDEYLSGNVKQKYKEVEKQIYENNVEGLEKNLESLKEAFPQDKSIKDIYFNLGMPFIPDEVYTKFAKHALKMAGMKEEYFKDRGLGHNGLDGLKVRYSGYGYTTNLREILRVSKAGASYKSFYDDNPFYIAMLSRNNTQFMSYENFRKAHSYLDDDSFEKMKRQALLVAKFEEIFSRQTRVIEKVVGYDDKDKEIRQIHPDLSADLNSVSKDIQEQFMQFVLSDLEVQKAITKAYNDTLNTEAKRNYEGNYLNLANISDEVNLREHQKSAAWRAILNRSTLINHEVGAGKTMTGAVIAIESKAMNLVNKPMIVAPNHLLPSWEAELKKLYPNKNILIADHKSMNKNKREQFLSKIKLNDYDLIVIKESQFKLIKKNFQALLHLEQERLLELELLKDQADSEQDRFLSKIYKKEIDKQTKIIDKLFENENKTDNMLSFDELGIDCLIIDEAHSFKNLSFTTQKQKVLGLGNSVGSAKAKELYTITQQFYEENKKVIFLTGTPISNSLSEMYHMQRYLQPNWLQERGLNNFDAWANTFGNDVSDYELDAGGTPKMVTRFSEFNNLTELIGGFSEVNDYVNKEKIEENLGTNLIPKAKIQKVVAKRSPQVADFFGVPDRLGNYPEGSLLWRFENFKDDPISNNPLRLTSYARLASLDYRCIENKPEFDFADSKINLCVKNIIENYYHNKAEFNSTQLVFCDLAVAKTKLADINTQTQEPTTQKEEKTSIIENAFSIIYTDGNIEKLDFNEYEKFIKAQNFKLSKEEFALALEQGWAVEQDENATFHLINPNSAESEIDNNARVENFTNTLTRFDAYKDIATKLMKAGIPKEHIAFIHDYKKDKDKQELYKKLNNGEIRILIGSTEKMGTGMNVQKRLVALHNLDCPWRPDGYIQRIGRIERQGNMFYEMDSNFKPQIYNYATEMSYDVKAYQIVETKAKAIDTIQRANELNIHSFEDISQNAITFAEMKAISSGNPLLLEQFKIDNELKTLQKQQKLFLLNQCEAQNRIDELEKQERRSSLQIESLEAIQKALALHHKKMQLDYSHLQNPKMVEFYKNRSYENNEKFTLFTHSKMQGVEETTTEANEVFKERIRSDIKEYKDNTNRYKNSTRKYFPEIMSYKGINIIPKMEENAVQFSIMAKNEKNPLIVADFFNRDFNYTIHDTDYFLEPKSLRMSKDMFFNNIDFDYFLKRVDNFVKDIDKHLQNEKQNYEKIIADKNQAINFLEQSKGEFPKQKLLEALKNDKEIIIDKIKEGDKAWTPSYKMLKEKQSEEKAQEKDCDLIK